MILEHLRVEGSKDPMGPQGYMDPKVQVSYCPGVESPQVQALIQGLQGCNVHAFKGPRVQSPSVQEARVQWGSAQGSRV